MSGDEVFDRAKREPDPVTRVDPLRDPERHYHREPSGMRAAKRPGAAPWSTWEAIAASLSTIPDMSEAACKGMHPDFDWPAPVITDDPSRPRSGLLTHLAHEHFAVALRICAGCPYSGVDGECVRALLERDPRYSGVAGGEVFLDGRRIPPGFRYRDRFKDVSA